MKHRYAMTRRDVGMLRIFTPLTLRFQDFQRRKVDNVLREAISDKDPNIRAQAADAIARRGSEEAEIYLRQALQDKNENVRFSAISNVYDDVNLLEQASLNIS